jgi:hypothetical protein
VSLSSALSITTGIGVPRTVFVDYPLGRTAGKPDDVNDQYSIVRAALSELMTATGPGAVVRLPNRWSDDDRWKDRAQRTGWSVDGLTPVEASMDGSDDRADRSDQPQWQAESDRLAWETAHPS